MLSCIERFKKNVAALFNTNSADFMRMVNVYLSLLQDELHSLGDVEINKKISSMQMYVQFTPVWDIETTKRKLLKDAEFLDSLLQAHVQDWQTAGYL